MSDKYVLGPRAAEDFKRMRAAYSQERIDKRPMRKRQGVPGSPIKLALYDGTRNGKCYTGHLLNESTGTASEIAVQWMFPNDAGTDDLLDADDVVFLLKKCPAYLEDDADWYTTGGAKYLAVLSPWAALA